MSYEYENRRKRSDNWDQEEKDLLINLVSQHPVIEDKTGDGYTKRMKRRAWLQVYDNFATLNEKGERPVKQIIEQWRRMKQNARRSLQGAGSGAEGGTVPVLPSETDLRIGKIMRVNGLDQGQEIQENIQKPQPEKVPSRFTNREEAPTIKKHLKNRYRFIKRPTHISPTQDMKDFMEFKRREHEMRMNMMREMHEWKREFHAQALLHAEEMHQLQAERTRLEIISLKNRFGTSQGNISLGD